jgi:hypothetical protein
MSEGTPLSSTGELAFNTATALTALVSAAAVTERNRTYLEIKHLCDELSDTVFALRPGTQGDRRRPRGDSRRRSQDN